MEVRLVRWVDSAAQTGWGDRSLFNDHGVSDNESVGFVLREDETQVVLVQSVDLAHGNLDAALAVPRVAITSSRTLAPGTES